MVTQIALTVRPVIKQDRGQLANIIHFENHVHRHLDWRTPLEWLGHSPYLVAERGSRIVAALACPPDPPNVAWIRMFAASSQIEIENAWELLWEKTTEQLSGQQGITAAAIPLQKWFEKLLVNQEFINDHNVVVLVWNNHMQQIPAPKSSLLIRQMESNELERVHAVDTAAFAPLWRNSLESIQLAYAQATLAAVAEDEQGIVGYQISTPNPVGAHLARLAVHPRAQGKGVGFALVRHLQGQFSGSDQRRISVNTQDNNLASLALYAKAGFSETGEVFPVYQKSISD